MSHSIQLCELLLHELSRMCELSIHQSQLGFSEIQAELTNLPILPISLPDQPNLIFKFHFILEYFNLKLSTCWPQSDVFSLKVRILARLGKLDY